MFLEGPGRIHQAVLTQLVLVRLNLILAEPASLQLEDRALQLTSPLATEQLGRQIPVGSHGKGAGDLLAGSLPLLILQPADEHVLDRVAKIAFVVEIAQFLEELGGQLGQTPDA